MSSNLGEIYLVWRGRIASSSWAVSFLGSARFVRIIRLLSLWRTSASKLLENKLSSLAHSLQLLMHMAHVFTLMTSQQLHVNPFLACVCLLFLAQNAGKSGMCSLTHSTRNCFTDIQHVSARVWRYFDSAACYWLLGHNPREILGAHENFREPTRKIRPTHKDNWWNLQAEGCDRAKQLNFQCPNPEELSNDIR